jgi:hypothetical protein
VKDLLYSLIAIVVIYVFVVVAQEVLDWWRRR